MNPTKPKSPPPLDLADELIAFNEKHPELENYIEKGSKVAENYFQKPKLQMPRPLSPMTVKGIDYIPAHKFEIVVTEEQKKDREIGISIAEVRPLLKNAWQRCVVL